MERYQKSVELTTKSRLYTPGGAQTSSKRPERFPEGAFPAYLGLGEGAKVWDVDGHQYVDWICGLGAVPLGYKHRGVTGAIYDQMMTGLISSSLPTPLEEEIASRLVKIIPCGMDQGQVRFVKTGSEACSGAIRIARRATERELIILVGYHGWHDWAQSTNPDSPGIPQDPNVLRVPYNDANMIQTIMKWRKVAAVILEPTLLEEPRGNYLSDVVTLCALHGALSIFDEMVMGFRWALAGGQEFFRITPDLAVFGKGLANGMPLACVVGPERFLRYADVVSGTFGGECLSLAAAGAVLDAYEGHGPDHPLTKQWEFGQWFQRTCAELEIPCSGYPVHPKIDYEGREMAIFLQETARQGLLIHPGGFNVSAALTPEDLKITERALRKGRQALDEGTELEGRMPVQSLLKRGD